MNSLLWVISYSACHVLIDLPANKCQCSTVYGPQTILATLLWVTVDHSTNWSPLRLFVVIGTRGIGNDKVSGVSRLLNSLRQTSRVKLEGKFASRIYCFNMCCKYGSLGLVRTELCAFDWAVPMSQQQLRYHLMDDFCYLINIFLTINWGEE